MELQQLKTFRIVAEAHSFTKASELLNYAQSSISAQIRLLEEELQVKLFERIGRRIFLTKPGEKLLAYAEQILKLEEEAKAVITGSDLPKGTLIIGAPESICIYRLPKILQEYRRRYPEVEIVLKLGSCADIFNWARNNVVDIALLMDNRITIKDLVIESLKPENITLVVAMNHPLSDHEHISPSDLEGEHLILIEKDACYRCLFEGQLAQAEVQLGSTLEIGSIETIKKCVISGLGISLLPQMTVEQELSAGTLKNLHWTGSDFDIFTLMIYHKDKWLSPAMEVFMELTRKLLKG
ncbi:LysR family transcriptional regulator [Cellulosilyticum sp. I15G10I2]|uniref:LysR family transcriptional regulator n=1 Tax=Cellulosilyticum sp. I15G10I2 TaxID=1892843 RepID=UPI00085C958C|nr:LysR family transcriptional regulator [Cellulosilyticum sp. I15G10I2]